MDRRDSTEIVYELLLMSKRGVTKREIVHEASLNFRLATRYTSHLTEMGLIRNVENDELPTKYWLTAKGEKVLKILSKLEGELSPFGLLAKTQTFSTLQTDDGALRVQESTNPFRVKQHRGGRLVRLRPFISYVLVVLAGIGLGYLLP